MRGTGADQPVVAMKPGNGGGAKGLNGSVLRGRINHARGGDRWRRQAVRDFQTGGLGSVPEGQGQHGAAGVDGQSIEAFETDLKSNLYKIWNRMSSGSYFPPPVRLVEIPKGNGGIRPLGIPTVADRRGADGRQDASGATGGAALPSRLLRVSTRQVGAGCGGDGAAAVLAATTG